MYSSQREFYSIGVGSSASLMMSIGTPRNTEPRNDLRPKLPPGGLACSITSDDAVYNTFLASRNRNHGLELLQ